MESSSTGYSIRCPCGAPKARRASVSRCDPRRQAGKSRRVRSLLRSWTRWVDRGSAALERLNPPPRGRSTAGGFSLAGEGEDEEGRKERSQNSLYLDAARSQKKGVEIWDLDALK